MSTTNEVCEGVEKILTRLEEMETRLKEIESSSRRMDNHIDFVNQCYIAFRFPLEVGRTIVTRVAPIFGIEDARQRPLLPYGETKRYDKIIRQLEASALPYLPEDQLPRQTF